MHVGVNRFEQRRVNSRIMGLNQYEINIKVGDYIAELQAVYLCLHWCDATYVETVPVVGQLQCQVTLKCQPRRADQKSMFKKTHFLPVTMVKN